MPADHNILAMQERVFRLASDNYGLTRKVIEAETGIPASTVKCYAEGRSVMSLSAFVALLRVLPDELSSLFTEPAGKHIGTDETDDGDLDALGREAASFTSDYVVAKSDGVVTHIERAKLKAGARRLAPKARAVAA